jgi:hypothetical protein
MDADSFRFSFINSPVALGSKGIPKRIFFRFLFLYAEPAGWEK